MPHYVKSVQIWSFSGPYFPVVGLNAENYSSNLRIQSEFRKIRTRKNYLFGQFQRSASQKLRIGRIFVSAMLPSTRTKYNIFGINKNYMNHVLRITLNLLITNR